MELIAAMKLSEENQNRAHMAKVEAEEAKKAFYKRKLELLEESARKENEILDYRIRLLQRELESKPGNNANIVQSME